jgi:Zn-dependent peptidase ImmA (M78 family)
VPIHLEMASLHTNRGANRAREARAALGLHVAEPLPCLLTIVEELTSLPVMIHVLPEDVAGCLWHEGTRRLIHLNGVHGLPRQRFTLAHELGHVRCGHDGALPVDDVATVAGNTAQPVEIEANAFAAEFLIPRCALEATVDGDPTLDTLVVLAAFFGVSAIMTLFRLKTCGLVSDGRAERLRAQIDAREHLARHRALAPAVVDDRLAAIEQLPYLSPRLGGSALAAAIRGETSIDQAAQAAGIAPATLMPAVVALSEPGAAAR